MALKDLLTALEADAASETERLLAETDAEALRIVESAKLEARKLEEHAVREHEADLAREVERSRSEARLAAAAMLRDAHEVGVATLQEALRERLRALRETDRYPAVMRALIGEGVAALPNASLLRVDPRDAELARRIVSELDVGLELRPELDTLGGVEVAADDGRVARNTFEERLRNAERELRVLAGELLEATEAPSVAAEAVP